MVIEEVNEGVVNSRVLSSGGGGASTPEIFQL